MNIAITVWGNRVSPVFDVAGTLLVAQAEHKQIIKKRYLSFEPGSTEDLLKLLKKLDVKVLICGAISTAPAELIISNHIRLVSFVSGSALNLLENFTKTLTIEKSFMMPGCSRHYSHQPPKPDNFHL